MDITDDDSGGGGCPAIDGTPSFIPYGAVPSVTRSHTVSGTARLLLVGVSFNNDFFEVVSGVTYNGVPLTLVPPVGWVETADDARVEIWSLVNPPTGTHDVVVTFSPALFRGGTVGVMSFTAVDQTTPLGPFAGAAAQTGTNATVDITSAVGELVFGTAAVEGTPAMTLTVGPGQTEHWNINNAARDYGAGSTEPGAPTVAMSWTLNSSDHWAVGGVSIKCGRSISGTVSEDVNGDANLADAVVRDNATVTLYRDNGDVSHHRSRRTGLWHRSRRRNSRDDTNRRSWSDRTLEYQ